MNKIKEITIALVVLTSFSVSASDYVMNDYQNEQQEQQEQSIDSGDPCVVVMCMFGKATGNSGGEQCSSPEKTFFNIIKKKKGSFLPNHTFDARKAFISKCDTATPDVINKIVGVFGKVKL